METEDIVRKLHDYLNRNPNAADTLEGICKWWIQFECIEQSVDKVSAALEILVAKGLLRKQQVAGSSTLYFMRRGN